MTDSAIVYGVCRKPGCNYVWLSEPRAVPNGMPYCPSCLTPGWPMTPAEAKARWDLKKGELRVGDPCPVCGKPLKECLTCKQENLHSPVVCATMNGCGFHPGLPS